MQRQIVLLDTEHVHSLGIGGRASSVYFAFKDGCARLPIRSSTTTYAADAGGTANIAGGGT